MGKKRKYTEQERTTRDDGGEYIALPNYSDDYCYENLKERDQIYLENPLNHAENVLKAQKIYDDDRYEAASSVLKIMEEMQKHKIELPNTLTFCNSKDKKIILSKEDAQTIEQRVQSKCPEFLIKPIELKIALTAHLMQILDPTSPVFTDQQINEALKNAGYYASEADLNLEHYLENLSDDSSEDDHVQQDISNESSINCIGTSHDFLDDECPS